MFGWNRDAQLRIRNLDSAKKINEQSYSAGDWKDYEFEDGVTARVLVNKSQTKITHEVFYPNGEQYKKETYPESN